MDKVDPGSEELGIDLSTAVQDDLNTARDLSNSEHDISIPFGSMLCTAAYRGHLGVITMLISRGADVNSYDDGDVALLAAARGAQAGALELLIENGADVRAKGPRGASALHQAVITDQTTRTDATLEIINQLLGKGLGIDDPDDEGHTAFHEASLYGRVDLMNRLIALQANINAKDNWHDTPLDLACLNNYVDAVKLLVSQGAEINSHSGGCRGLGRAAGNGNLELVTVLLNNGAKTLPVSKEGPELLYAARSGACEIIQLLLNHAPGNQGPISMFRAAVMDPVHVIARLIDHGVSVDVKNSKQQTPLHLAVLSKKVERQSPLGVLYSRNEVIKLLIDKGAKVNAVDANGKTAHVIASELGYSDAVEMLVQRTDE